MCSNIKTLFNFEPPVTSEEVRAASLQFVRKIPGSTSLRRRTKQHFRRRGGNHKDLDPLLHSLETTAPPKNREEEAAKAKARAAERYANNQSGAIAALRAPVFSGYEIF